MVADVVVILRDEGHDVLLRLQVETREVSQHLFNNNNNFLFQKFRKARPFMDLSQRFPTFFGLRHPYLVLKIFGGTPSWLIRYKDQEIVIFGGTPGTS